ncbi:MAG: AAA family ATPase, partial [Ignavibacteriaceae bacterium]|nr:AAA family ATPase [Ignavibacteriaceae bacterium]
MHLSKLDILGFKSFANKTVVNFNHGITAIVGPNGCGKTNIVDALRWCLGEQKSSILRSDKMENVIFNGTSSKKPLGVAEVSLTIQNDKGILPTEYSEVIITRRIYRSGESEYLLNKNIARLKDITGLFMDTGMGANAYSVIELKMVESILSNKTEERRAMFEEAAGVNKYKVRRKLTLRKLEEVRIDLNRASDLISEIEKKVISLERQAKKSEKYKQLSERLKEIELSNASFEVFILVDETNKWEESLEHSKSLKEEIEAKLKDTESEHETVKSEILVIEGELKEVRKNISSLTEKIYLIERNISVSKETKNSLDKNIHRYTDEIKEFEYRIEQVSESLEELREKEGSYDGLIALKQKEKDGFEAEVVKIKEQLEESRKSLRQFTAEMNEKSKNFNELGNKLKGLELQLSNNEKSKISVESSIKELTAKNEVALNSKNELLIKKETFVNTLEIANSEFEKLSNLKEKLENEIS